MNIISVEPNMLTPTTRHDGWTGEAMAKFLETLAETGIVIDACDAAGKSSPAAYALRRRNPLFAQAWELALGNARDRLADTLLARSIEGNVEQIIKDGAIVAEKHFLDNRLGLAILKRLDQRADGIRRPPPPLSRAEPDWDVAITALRTGKEDDIAAALAMLRGPEVSEVSTPLFDEFEHDQDSFNHPRIWHSRQTDEWCTNYPPPPGFGGDEDGVWEDETYCRALSEEELAALVAAGIAERPEDPVQISIEDDEIERAAFFESLAANSPERASKNEIVAAQADA
jgi:hypothetical protein